MKYLDANVFILSAIYTGEKTDKASKILQSLSQSTLSCATSSLTLDEILWVTIKVTKEREKAIKLCKFIMELPNLEILDVTGKDILKALWFMEKYTKLKPRDAIHLAVCSNAGIFTIVTDDSDFDDIVEVNREGLE